MALRMKEDKVYKHYSKWGPEIRARMEATNWQRLARGAKAKAEIHFILSFGDHTFFDGHLSFESFFR